MASVPAYDLMFRRHPDLTHLRLLAYRFMQRLRASTSRNEKLEGLWGRPGDPEPQYDDIKYLVSGRVKCEEDILYWRRSVKLREVGTVEL